MYFAEGGNALYPVVCSGWKCVDAMYTSAFLLTFATSRNTASPFRLPRPGSITSVAREPTTMPTFGTSPTLRVRNHVGVRRELHRGVLAHQRIRRGPALGADAGGREDCAMEINAPIENRRGITHQLSTLRLANSPTH